MQQLDGEAQKRAAAIAPVKVSTGERSDAGVVSHAALANSPMFAN